ncbi:MAG: ComEC/Rec2 family competence protein, partial [Planctomycetota bacterium]
PMQLSLRRQPLVAAAVAWGCGHGASQLPAPVTATLLWGLALTLPLAFVSRSKVLRRRRGTVLLGGFPLLLGLLAALHTGGLEKPPRLPKGPLELNATVVGTPRPRLATRFSFRADPVPRIRVRLSGLVSGGTSVEGSLTVLLPGDPPLGRGDRLRLEGWWDADGGWLRVRHPAHCVVLSRSLDPRGLLDRARRGLRRSWQLRFGERTSAWLAAVLLGDRGLLAEPIRERFRRVGQSHILAISGLHVGILLALLLAPLRRWTWLGARGPYWLAGVLLVLYAGLAGGDAPVVRAVVFGVLGSIAVWRGRGPSLANALAAAFLLLSAWRGGSEISASFLFSFCAVAGIAFLRADEAHPSEPQSWRQRFLRRQRHTLKISASAWLGVSIPLVWWTPEVVVWAPLFSLLLIPLLTLLLCTGVGALLPALPGSDWILGGCCRSAVWLLEELSLQLDRLPGTPGSWPLLPPLAVALAITSGAAWLRGRRSRGWPLLLLGAAGVAALAPRPGPSATLLAMGRGQALLIQGQEGTLLYDAGSLDRREGGALVIREALREGGRCHLDLVILSHPHADHLVAIPGLLERISIGTVLVGPRFQDSELGSAVSVYLQRAGVPLIPVAAGDRVAFGNFAIEVLHPPRIFPALLS